MDHYKAVVLGISAGGFQALGTLLPSLHAQFPLPLLIVQHQHASSDNYLATRLNQLCPLRVKTADEKEAIVNGVIYLAPPNYHLMVETDHTLSLSVCEKVNFARPSIDVLFETAADAYHRSLIGVILTGSGKDGSQGLKRIKELGGRTVVQDPQSAEVKYMPLAAIKSTSPHHILPLHQIPQLLIRLAAGPIQ